jgi:hypothetical protein
MRIRLLAVMAGPQGVLNPGVHDVPSRQALLLAEGGYAELLDVLPVVATPVISEPELKPTPPLAPELEDDDNNESDGDDEIETAALDGAPEAAVTRRGRKRRQS